ncbi:amidohydrolase-domain-containing protein [Crucibulum laeve]|uniref:Amidohydrolase-domain-containing protein n=1 Tax=Crucibulum laeve TaxID=68775 RepID=A0A5C3M0G9_9AGAR|nr:amidohydrolase-domain-containing protein [Crucibulum laeve]
MSIPVYPQLHAAAFNHPAIDNHAHPLLAAAHRDALPFEGLISEAEGDSLTQDAVHTLACFRATAELRPLFGLGESATWDDIKAARARVDYTELCKRCMEPTGIQCILIDDGLGGVKDLAQDYKAHDQFTPSPTKRIVRVEIVAEVSIPRSICSVRPHLGSDTLDVVPILDAFVEQLSASLKKSAVDPEVVGFKSIVCYRTGLDVSTISSPASLKFSLLDMFKMYQDKGSIRLARKALNDQVVRITLEIAGKHDKPVQFHTGLGDNDITLVLSSPSRLQPIIRAYPQTKMVLLHSSYPYTREAGYLTAVYPNVYLDFGEVFPFVSGAGQRSIIRQVLELAPTNKIMWSTDGHWWPESYYLGTMQARQALYDVLKEVVDAQEATESQAVGIVENALFHTANKLYRLGLVIDTL